MLSIPVCIFLFYEFVYTFIYMCIAQSIVSKICKLVFGTDMQLFVFYVITYNVMLYDVRVVCPYDVPVYIVRTSSVYCVLLHNTNTIVEVYSFN